MDDFDKIYPIRRGLDTKWGEFSTSNLTLTKFGKVVLDFFSVELSPLNRFFVKFVQLSSFFLCELFSWERLSWSLYYDSLVAFHILDHSKWWLKLRPRCFNLLTASCLFDIIDAYEFVLLYHAYSSKLILPCWYLPRFNVEEWSDVDCKTMRRFAKKDLSELCESLGILEKITWVQRKVCGGMEGPYILLKRLAYLVNTQTWYPASPVIR